MIKNILVTSVGGDIGSNIINILINQNLFKCNLIAVDIKEYVFCKKLVNKFYIVPRTDNQDYIKAIKDIVISNKVELIIPSSEKDILLFDLNKDFFVKKNIKLLINKSKIINNFLDKEITSILLNNLNIKTPITYSLDLYNNELEFPIIVKAKKSTTSKIVNIINNIEQFLILKKMIVHNDDYIVQEYIGSIDEEYTTTVYKDGNIFDCISFKRELDGDKTGFAEIVQSMELREYSRVIAEHFLLDGSINIQSRKRNNNFYIFEINPRISSTVFIRDYFNFKDLIWWVCNLLDIPTNVISVDKSGIAVIGYTYNFYKKEVNEK